MINRNFFAKKILNYKKRVQKKPNVIKIRELENTLLTITKYLSISFRILEQVVDESSTIVNFTRHVYIVEKLKIKILIENNIFNSKLIILDVDRSKLTIENCKKIIIKFNIKNIDFSIKRVVRFSNVIKILIKFNIVIFFKLRDNNLFIDRDFIFVLKKINRLKSENDVLLYIVDVYIAIVHVININSKNIYLLKNSKLNII